MFQVLFVIFQLTIIVSSQQSKPFCVIDNTTSSSDPPLPKLPDQYQTVIEVNIVDKNYSLTAFEYFDYLGDRAALSMEKDGVHNALVFDYKNDELFAITGLDCRVSNVLENKNDVLFGNMTLQGVPHVFTTGGVLHFSKSFGEHYRGQTMVRGIQVDHWQSCLHWPGLQSTFILDYYFTVKYWADPVRYPQIPVRAVAKGQRTKDDGTVVDFLHYYEYINFKTTIDDPSVFETPKGVVCRGRTKLKPVPQLPGFFHFRQQVTRNNMAGSIFTSDVWYDYTYKLLRRDYKLPFQSPPLNTLNPITEIHDFNSGIKYFQDVVTKQCVLRSLNNDTYDVGVTGNGSYSVFMKDPMQFLQINSSYAYAGQRTTRGILCDVYSIIRYDIDNFKNIPAVVEFYFLADSLTEFPDDGSGHVKHVPVLMEVNVPKAGYKERVEFIDFDYGHPSLDVFIILACYSEAAKLQFTVKFAGQYKRANHNKILKQARDKITQAMGVMPIRIQAPKLKYDNSFIYVSAMLLDRSPYYAQFTQRSQKEIANQDDRVFPSSEVSSSSGCAKVCVENTNFTCNSFDYCSKNPVPCRISKAHISDGKSVLINSTCDHFSRTVTGPVIPELTMFAAYNNLTTAIYENLMQLEIDIPFSLDKDIYTSVDVSVTFGWLYPQGVPLITGQFSYHEEMTMPFSNNVVNSHVWYDYEYQLVRYDINDVVPTSTIQDFNAGLSYVIDKMTGKCVVSPLLSNTFDVTMAPSQKNYFIQVKNPLQFFDLNNNYKYAGQKSLRGLMCDVYENTQPSFNFGSGIQKPAIIQMYFLTQGWHELSSGSGYPVTSQPVKVIVSATDSSVTTVYDIYDFNEQHPDLSNFNIQPCFQGKGKDFLIKFNQTYHPVLERYLKDFQKQVQMTLAGKTGASPLRFQNPQITYSPQFTYYIGTIVEQAPYLLDFTEANNYVGVYSSDATYVGVTSIQQCAMYCRNFSLMATVPCMSFDYCSSKQLCQLSKSVTPDGNMLNQSTYCSHYSRTVASSVQIEPTVAAAFTMLQDQIAYSLLNITLQTREYQNVTYPAILLDRSIVRYDSEAIGRTTLSHFTRLKKSTVPGSDKYVIEGISVDDCAARCLSNVAFECQSFDYCADLGLCALSSIHPADGTVVPADHHMCDIFSRKYTDNYIAYPGQFINVYASAVIQNVNSAELCAYQCSNNATCKSFDYCANNKMCFLKTEHILHIPPVLVASSLTCSHYSRNYIKDFKKTPMKSLTTIQQITVTNVSSVLCAQLCVENTGFLCQTFTYCGNLTSCTIVGLNTASSASQIQDNTTCDLYNRYYFSQGSGHQSSSQSIPSNTTDTERNGYSTGAMVGVGAGTLLTGLVLGAVFLYIFQRKRLLNSKEQATFEMGVTNKNYQLSDEQKSESES